MSYSYKDKAKLEHDLAALQARCDTRDMQVQDAVRQLNISKFMLAENGSARSQVQTIYAKPSMHQSIMLMGRPHKQMWSPHNKVFIMGRPHNPCPDVLESLTVRTLCPANLLDLRHNRQNTA